MTANLKRAIRVLRAYGNKVETSKGRIIAINGDRVSRKSGIRSIDLERRALSLSQRKFDTLTLYSSQTPKQVKEFEKEAIKRGFTKSEVDVRRAKVGMRRVRRARRRYNKYASKFSGLQMSDKILAEKLADGETSDEIIADMRKNLLRKMDIARRGNVNAFNEYINMNRKRFPKTAAWIDAHPDYDISDTYLAEAQYEKYDETKSLEERDDRMVELLEEGSSIAADRLASVDAFYALG